MRCYLGNDFGGMRLEIIFGAHLSKASLVKEVGVQVSEEGREGYGVDFC